PTVLELGGKSPCIVDADASLAVAARRIVFGKYLNCGQTCVAPDYLLVHESVKKPLIVQLRKEIRRQFGAQPLGNPDYGKIINARHYDRLCAMLDEPVLLGGAHEDGRIEPTVLEASTESACMQEEIFGPILPVLTWTRWEEAKAVIRQHPTPLACYYFGTPGTARDRLRELSFGGGCINDTVMHLASNHLPFGGVGTSGMGCYHGRYGFETFSHIKSIVDKKTWIDLPVRYQPYDKWKDTLVRRFLR
ncbi:MAG: aldehyde dehydrogenase family protein, partial [Butyricicoccaceae bacterium]